MNQQQSLSFCLNQILVGLVQGCVFRGLRNMCFEEIALADSQDEYGTLSLRIQTCAEVAELNFLIEESDSADGSGAQGVVVLMEWRCREDGSSKPGEETERGLAGTFFVSDVDNPRHADIESLRASMVFFIQEFSTGLPYKSAIPEGLAPRSIALKREPGRFSY